MAELNIYEKLRKVQMALKVPKDQWNDFSKFNYRSAEKILEEVKPLLTINGLTLYMTDSVENHGDRYYVKAKVVLTDGEKEITVTALAREQEAKKGMTEDQITGSASSYARKYALGGLFAIDDGKDADSQDNRQGAAKKVTSEAATSKQRELIADKLDELGITGEQQRGYLVEQFGVEVPLTKEGAAFVIDELLNTVGA